MFVPLFLFWFVMGVLAVGAYPQQMAWLAAVYLCFRFVRRP